MKHPMFILLLFISFQLNSYLNIVKESIAAKDTCTNPIDPLTIISEGLSLLKEGDLVVRLTRDPISWCIKNFNRHDKSYSHSGIVLYDHGYPYIYHIVNGEENPDEKLRKDSLSHFCNPRKNSAFGIYRYNMNTGEIKKLKELIHYWYDYGLQFDSAFNLNTDDRMYCSEMISKALEKATDKRISIERTQMTKTEAKYFSFYTHLPFTYTSSLKIVTIDGLYFNPYCHVIKEYKYSN